jgi:hypothetical protein
MEQIVSIWRKPTGLASYGLNCEDIDLRVAEG